MQAKYKVVNEEKEMVRQIEETLLLVEVQPDGNEPKWQFQLNISKTQIHNFLYSYTTFILRVGLIDLIFCSVRFLLRTPISIITKITKFKLL